jgi:branched-chain amino acid transport system substrate-binding protein
MTRASVTRGRLPRLLSPLLVVGSVVILAACGSSSKSTTSASSGSGSSNATGTGSLKCKNGHILIGFDKGFSGPASFFDTAGYQGTLVAIHDLNAAGGLHGCKLTWTNGDMQSNPPLGAQVATELINKGVQILIVPDDFDVGIAAAETGHKAGLLTISTAASSTQFGLAVGPHMFSGALDTTAEGIDAAKFALSRGWKSTFEVLDPTLEYFTLQDKAYRSVYTPGGGKIVGTSISKSFASGQADFSSTISAIQSTNPKPQVIYTLLTFPSVGTFVKQLRAAGIDTPVLGDTTIGTRDFPKLVGPAATKNVYYVTQVFYEGTAATGVDPAIVKFDQEYQQMFGKFPEQGNAPNSFQSFNAILDALKQSGVTDAATAAAAINAQHNLPVPGGTLVDWHNGYAVWNGTIVGFTPSGQFQKIEVIPSSSGE